MSFEQVYQVAERGRISIPLTSVFSGDNFTFSEYHEKSTYFRFTIRNNQFILHAGKYVGLIPLNEKIGVFVQPKIGTSNWMHLVGLSNTKLHSINELRMYGLDTNPALQIIEYIIETLCSQLELVNRQGMLAEYKHFETITQYPRGRILFKKSISLAWAKGKKRSLAVKYFEFSRDTIHNRYIKSALILARTILASNPNPNNYLQERVHSYLQFYQKIPFERGINQNNRIKRILENSQIPHFRSYYIDILNTASLLIENTNIDVFQDQDFKGPSFVVDMEAVFEQYCQNLMKDSSNKIRDGLIALDQHEGKKPLFSSGPDNRLAEPDILLVSRSNSEENVLSVLDVKYKSNPSRNDLNQIITYAHSYNTDKSILLCFADNLESEGVEYLGEVNGITKVWIYRIFLGGQNIVENENNLLTSVGTIISN